MRRLRNSISLTLTFVLLACGAEDDGAESTATLTTAQGTSGGSTTLGSTDESTSESGETGPVGEEYGPCQDVSDCPEGTLYACVSNVTEGHVCAIGCEQHADCPPPPPGGSTTPACTTVDDRKRCIMAGCQMDSDCPSGMTCHIEGPNWCHWPL